MTAIAGPGPNVSRVGSAYTVDPGVGLSPLIVGVRVVVRTLRAVHMF